MRRLLACTLAILLGGAGAGLAQAPNAEPPAPPPGADELLTEAAQRLERGDAATAIGALRAALALRPGHVETILKLCEACLLAGRGDEALALVESAFAEQPGALPLRVRLAELRERAGRPGAAAALLAPIADELPPEASIMLASLHARGGHGAEGERVLERALARDGASQALWLAYIDAALSEGHAGVALRRTMSAVARIGWRAELHLRAAQAHFAQGNVLGDTQVRRVPEGRAGQFSGDWLLLEAREDGRFLCCPAESAMHQVRRALDGGCDEPAAHLLHARLWLRAGRAEVAWRIVAAHAPRLTAAGDPEVLAALGEVALAAGEVREFLRFAQARADALPEQRDVLLCAAYREAAEHYGRSGDAVLHAAMLRNAAAHCGPDTGLMLRLADAEWVVGRKESAVRGYRQVLERAPGHPERARLLSRIGE
ncbi:MAG: tetratricopeptide repeat protein [Phycisphaerae bacterium]|nr:tetratricopeptide repeat protein [Phycisphaerae bacterium]MCZ2399371.1 tetratricopeptide repeat protein [Phycisphaerae bacterium]